MSSQIAFRKQIEGFPFWQIFIFSLVRLSEPIIFTSLFPYVYFMVRDFGIAKDESEVSKYVGLLSSVFAFFEFATPVFWGNLAGYIGRRNVIVIGLLGSAFVSIIFGFSQNYWTAFAARSMLGAINGNGGVARTMLGEIAPDPRHGALAFSIIPLLWQLGCVIGPLSGHLIDISAHQKFPFAFANIVLSVWLVVSAIITLFFLEETHPKLKFNHQRFLEMGDKLRRMMGFKVAVRRSASPSVKSPYESPIQGPNENSPLLPQDQMTRKQSLMLPNIFRLLISNFIISLHCIIFDEFVPVFASFDIRESRFPFKTAGGLAMKSQTTGDLLSFTGFVGVLLVVFIYPYLVRTFCPLKIYRWMLGIFPISYFAVPYTVFALPPMGPAFLAPLLLLIAMLGKMVAGANAFPLVFLLIHLFSPEEQRSFINDVTISTTALARFIGPVAWGYIMGVSDAMGRSWIMWGSLACIGLAAWIQSFKMDSPPTSKETDSCFSV